MLASTSTRRMPTRTFATRILPEAPAMGLGNERYRCQQFQLLERNLLVATIAGGKRRVATSDRVQDVDIIIIFIIKKADGICRTA